MGKNSKILFFAIIILFVIATLLLYRYAYKKDFDGEKIKGTNYFVSLQGDDSRDGLSLENAKQTIQNAIDIAKPGDIINLADGIYLQDFTSKQNGKANAPIVIRGSPSAIIKGNGRERVIEINHDFITLEGFTVDGLFDASKGKEGYRNKLIYAIGKEKKNGVTGMRIKNMTIKNAAGECVRLRYFAQKNEILNNSISYCGTEDFIFKAGKKNGEGVYIGTAPEQLNDGKNPTNDIDRSNGNRVFNNIFNTQGNECVDIKEGSSGNIVENNKCTGQKDSESAGMDSRGNENTFRNNEIFDNIGAGIRFGGDTEKDGIRNSAYENVIRNNKAGGIKFQRGPQEKISDNVFLDNAAGDYVGDKAP